MHFGQNSALLTDTYTTGQKKKKCKSPKFLIIRTFVRMIVIFCFYYNHDTYTYTWIHEISRFAFSTMIQCIEFTMYYARSNIFDKLQFCVNNYQKIIFIRTRIRHYNSFVSTFSCSFLIVDDCPRLPIRLSTIVHALFNDFCTIRIVIKHKREIILIPNTLRTLCFLVSYNTPEKQSVSVACKYVFTF